jgi:hypothetical protein
MYSIKFGQANYDVYPAAELYLIGFEYNRGLSSGDTFYFCAVCNRYNRMKIYEHTVTRETVSICTNCNQHYRSVGQKFYHESRVSDSI